MTPPRPLTLTDWHAAYAAGASPAQLLEVLRARLADASPNDAWISRIGVEALAAALDGLAQRAAAAGGPGALPLYGVPFAVKDNIDVAGFPTTAACPAYAYTPARHATAVARLVDAGAICIGKTNLDQFATGLVGARSPYGRPSSAFSARHASGGSSSGSAVVVARGDVPFALGTDTAGSGRVPAGFNHIVGLKPTPGRVGTRGVVPACRSLDCVSILALTVADAAAVLATIEGADPDDAYSRFAPGPAALPASSRVAVPAAPTFGPTGDDTGAAACFAAAVAHLRTLGHAPRGIDVAPLLAIGRSLYDGPRVAERHAVVQPLLDRRPEAIDPSVRRVIAAAAGYTATDAFRAEYALQQHRLELASFWDATELLMVPTAPEHPTHAAIDADPIGVNARLGIYTNFVNLLGWCALALPFGFTPEGLPFGVTFIAPAGADAALARFGARWTASLGLTLGATGVAAPPGAELPVAPASRPTLPVAVVGAHLSGQPLNGQLTGCGAVLREATTTAPCYRLHALAGTVPPKPGLERVGDGDGGRIEVEVWDVPAEAVGGLLALIPPPLGLGTVELADGRGVHGFICEPYALDGATDITAHGGWRAFLAARGAAATATAAAVPAGVPSSGVVA